MKTIAQQLQQQRKALKISQKELGSKLGLPQSHISSIENGKTDPRLSTLIDMVNLLEIELTLVPHKQRGLIKSLLSDTDTSQKPCFLPDEEDDND